MMDDMIQKPNIPGSAPQEGQAAPKGSGRKRPRFLVRLVLFLVALVMVLLAVAAVAFRDVLNLDSVKRWFTYRTLMLSDSGQADAFHYDGALGDSFTVLGGDLLVCSQNAISLYSGSGTRYVHETVSLDAPVVDSNGTLAVVYDAGGTSLYVLGQRELIFSSTGFEPILSAHLNRSGQLTVVTQESGYRGSVTVYSSAYEAVASVRLSSAFVMDAALSDDGRTLSILTIGQDNGSFSSPLSLYSLNSASAAADEAREFRPDAVFDLGGNVILQLRHTADRVWALGDKGMSVISGGQSAYADFSGRYLRAYDLSGDGFAAALLGKYRAGSQAVLQIIDGEGVVSGSLELNEQVLSLAAAGRYFAVLTGNRLDIYTSDLTLYATLDGTQGARRVLLMRDGSAILISSDTASYFVPN